MDHDSPDERPLTMREGIRDGILEMLARVFWCTAGVAIVLYGLFRLVGL